MNTPAQAELGRGTLEVWGDAQAGPAGQLDSESLSQSPRSGELKVVQNTPQLFELRKYEVGSLNPLV